MSTEFSCKEVKVNYAEGFPKICKYDAITPFFIEWGSSFFDKLDQAVCIDSHKIWSQKFNKTNHLNIYFCIFFDWRNSKLQLMWIFNI